MTQCYYLIWSNLILLTGSNVLLSIVCEFIHVIVIWQLWESLLQQYAWCHPFYPIPNTSPWTCETCAMMRCLCRFLFCMWERINLFLSLSPSLSVSLFLTISMFAFGSQPASIRLNISQLLTFMHLLTTRNNW